MLDTRNANALAVIPLLLAINGRFTPTQRSQFTLYPVTGFPVVPIDRDGAVELQITDIISAIVVDVVEDVGIGEVTVEGEITRNVLLDDPINQFLTQDSMVLEGR